jgi:hypothetical protein
MAQFIGNSDEFIKFIGGYARNKVQTLTRTYRKNIGKCEECGSRTKKLDAAHVTGKERPVLISNILNNFIDEKGIITLELQDFEDQFCIAHNPIETSVRILCKECHREYDKAQNSAEPIIDESDEEIDYEKIEQKDIAIVAKIIEDAKMNKSKAVAFVLEKTNTILDNKSVIYSNVNNTVNVWWLEPTNDKFKKEISILLNNSIKRKLFLFRIPANTIENPQVLFEQRKDKGASKITLEVSDVDFIDKKGFNFNDFLINSIEY